MNTDALVGDIVTHWHREGAVCFAVDVKHSLHVCAEFRRAGVLAEHIDGTTPLDERTAILAKMSTGEIQGATFKLGFAEDPVYWTLDQDG
jgi:DNA repair protein RadD